MEGKRTFGAKRKGEEGSQNDDGPARSQDLWRSSACPGIRFPPR